MDGMAEPSWPRFRGEGISGTRGRQAAWNGCRTRAGRIADLGLGLDRQRVITGGAMLWIDAALPALPNFDSTTASTGRQSQMRLSASPRPVLPAP